MTIFDNITGNPPYQKNNENTKDDPLFQYFYDFAKTYGTRYCLISPAKFLFNLGATPKPWNKLCVQMSTSRWCIMKKMLEKYFQQPALKVE